MDQVRQIGRSYTVELPILSNTNSKISFGDNETMLDNVLVTGISILGDYIGASLNGRSLMSNANVAKGYLTLSDGQKKEYNKQLPLELFYRNDSIIHIEPRVISIRNCYVDFPLINSVVIPAGPPAGLAVMFVFFYESIK